MLNKKLFGVFIYLILCLNTVNIAYSATGVKKTKHIDPVSEQKSVTSKAFNYQIGPKPTFVAEVKVPTIVDLNEKLVGDQLYLIFDRQLSLLDGQTLSYWHTKTKVLSNQSLQNASQIYINFNPEYEKLTLHAIRVWRDGKPIDLTEKVKLDLFQREKNLEKNLYEGNVTALGVLPSIFVGDEIELEYTIAGSNPILGKKHSGIYSITREYFTNVYSLRIYLPENESIHVVTPPSTTLDTDVVNGVRRYMVRAEKVAPWVEEDNIPNWYNPTKQVQVSQYDSWPQVSDWAGTLFNVSEPVSPEIQQIIQSWKSAGLTKEQLTVEVLNWVQSEIRYFGIELGVNSHLPTSPNLTVSRKYGDCKDKALLTHVLLHELDIHSTPVLASMQYRRGALNMIPSVAVFDHAIVKVSLNGKTYWLDPTLPTQSGSLDKLSSLDYGGALPLSANVSELDNIDYQKGVEDLYTVRQHFILRDFSQPVELKTEIKANGVWADYFRVQYQQQSKQEFAKSMQEDLLRVYPQLHEVSEVNLKDDKKNNEVIITANYQIDHFLNYEPGKLDTFFIANDLMGVARLPNATIRQHPYALLKHHRVTQIIEFDFPNESSFKPDKLSKTENGEYWNLSSTTNLKNQNLTQTWVLKANKEAVLPQRMADYITETKKIRDQLMMSFRLPTFKSADLDRSKLMRQLKSYDHYGQTKSGRVKTEIKSVLDLQLATKDIESGKLSGEYLSKAYEVRALSNDIRSNTKGALEDIRNALKLMPNYFEYQQFEAETLLGDAKFDEAKNKFEALFEKAEPKNDMAFIYRGYGQAMYYLGGYDKAREYFDKAVQAETEKSTLYSALWQYLAYAKTDEALANKKLKEVSDSAVERQWPMPILEMLSGALSPKQLIEAADSNDKGVKEDQLSEAYFYIGKKYQLLDEKEKAKEAFQRCLDQNVVPFAENNFALFELGKPRKPKTEGFFSGF